MSEVDLMNRIQKLATKLGARLFRQNSGLAWIGKVERGPRKNVTLEQGDIVIRKARAFHAGHSGISDLGGWVPTKVTHDMVGSTVAVYLQAEIKDKSRPTEEQMAWIDAVNRAGGRAGIVRSEQDLMNLLRGG